jgi:hypothetical protein
MRPRGTGLGLAIARRAVEAHYIEKVLERLSYLPVVGEFLKSCRSVCLVEAATVGLPSVRRKIQWRPL